MSLFTVDELVDGEYAVAAEINAMFNDIAAILNGGIAQENLADDLPFVVATSVGGLGSLRQGKAGLLKLGSSPYEMLPVVCDGSKWYSAPVWVAEAGFDATDWRFTYTADYLPTPCQALVKDWKLIHDAGMRLQVAYSCALATQDSALEARVGVNVYDMDATDTLASKTTGYDAQATTSTSFVYITRDWAQPSVTPTQKHGRIAIGCELQAPGGGSNYAQINQMSLGHRFVSA